LCPDSFLRNIATAQPIHLTYPNGPDIDAQGKTAVALEPRAHFVPRESSIGHLKVGRGVAHPLGSAGIKVVGDFVNSYPWSPGVQTT
jgi:alanine dehydrogenase